MDGISRIPTSEIKFCPLSVADTGRVFWWGNRLFRGIPSGHAADIQRLFDCGLIPALVEKGVFVRSWIAPLQVDGFSLIVEHEVIDVPTYPKEWTFSMLKDAGRLILDLNEAASKYGYQTKDCHGYNVLFKNSRPVFIDLGSFVKTDSADEVLFSFHEFMRSYYYPLQIWRTGGQYMGSRAVPRIGFLLPVETYLKYRWSFLRFFRDSFLIKVVRKLHAVRMLSQHDLRLLHGRYPSWLIAILSWLKNNNFLSGPARIGQIRRKLDSLSPPLEPTAWSDYHDPLNPTGKATATPRFELVAGKVSSLGARSVLEIAGNQGILSRLLASAGIYEKVICTDGDSSALDKGYRAAHRENANIHWATLDPFSYENNPLEIAPEQRFRADVVIALALTHHLTLTQNLGIGYVLDVLARFSKKYLLIEFMPLGLHDGVTAPRIPAWYSENWFRTEFEKRFEIVERTQLEENRVLFVGKIKQTIP